MLILNKKATKKQSSVLIPMSGIIPKVIPQAIPNANLAGDVPVFINPSNGLISLLLKNCLTYLQYN